MVGFSHYLILVRDLIASNGMNLDPRTKVILLGNSCIREYQYTMSKNWPFQKLERLRAMYHIFSVKPKQGDVLFSEFYG